MSESKQQHEVEESKMELVSICFVIQPEEYPHDMEFSPTTTIKEIIESVAKDLMLSSSVVSLFMSKGDALNNSPDKTLLDFGIRPGEKCHIHIHVDKNKEGKTSDANEGESASRKLPSEIEVEIWDEDSPTEVDEYGQVIEREEQVRIIKVQIESDETAKKPFYGGYRHKKTGVEYHHASCQMAPEDDKRKEEKEKKEHVVKFHRDTQTYTQKTRSVQTNRECGTQMERSDIVLDRSRDKVLSPREYFTSQQHHQVKLEKTIIFQRFWRGYKARERACRIREALDQRRRAAESKEAEEKEHQQKEHEKNVSRRMNPRTFADFEVLYNELEHWRQHETLRIENNRDLTALEKKKELSKLLHKETKLLQTIDRLKLSANEENRERRIARMLKLMASPKKWQLSDGNVTTVHTPFTNRAAELLELYNGVKLEGVCVDERLDILLHVKWTVKEFDCNLTRDIVDLIDREADLLHRGRSEKTMKGLRRRISNLFLNFIETPEFNPEAARFKKVPVGDWSDRPNIRPIRG